eukprot:CAMPEP_0181101700 /NCGR_PEP_ID=MMETSP1071-20121207/13904_1 /TAXON_ID=35127 /ORGANISM="Thalassiosira sp., Strain NH16" /LENGTH=960 /DNA_ID=CAMNT_0023184589 /DNA_START=125 /DNA_END=3007 /DNA_ORIENTATION=-
MSTRACFSAANATRRRLRLLPSSSSSSSSSPPMRPSMMTMRRSLLELDAIDTTTPCNGRLDPTTRSFATRPGGGGGASSNNRKNNNKKGGKQLNKQDAYKRQIRAQQQQQQRSIIGKRPGQTPFSPPEGKMMSATPMKKTTTTTQPRYCGPGSQNPAAARPAAATTRPNDAASIAANPSQIMPLVIPPSPSSSIYQTEEERYDNRDHAHDWPSISSFTQREGIAAEDDDEDNELRGMLMRRGVLPPPPRPVVDRRRGDDVVVGDATPQPVVEIPEADPSGVSHANPEDILDMASMYDPSIHLPDKPDFAAYENRKRYEAGTPLTDELIAYIGVRGPITAAEYMRRVLRDGEHGYYTTKGSRSGKKKREKVVGAASEDGAEDDNDWDLEDGDDDDDDIALGGDSTDEPRAAAGGEHVIGASGDFITAPEVSQLFGESLLVWLMTQYRTLNGPSRIQIIEIGPGKGTLICDMLRSAIGTFPDFAAALTEAREVEGGDSGDGEKRNGKVAVGVHLVEVTNGMRARQKESLQKLENEASIVEKGYSFQFEDDLDEQRQSSANDTPSSDDKGEQGANSPSESNDQDGSESSSTIHVSWHDVLSSVPTHDAATGEPIPTFVICQELVDALPIHSFQKTEDGWRERLVDVAVRDDAEASRAAGDVRLAVARRYASAESDDDGASSTPSSASSPEASNAQPPPSENGGKKLPRLRFVLPPDTTPALRSMLRVTNRGSPADDNPSAPSLNALPVGSIVEACPEGLVLAQDIADRIEKCRGGAALIVDYGGDGSSGGDTLRGFWKHSQVHPLSRPGEVDVTADVDFGALREAVNRRVSLGESLERKRRKEGGGKNAMRRTSTSSSTSIAIDGATKEIPDGEDSKLEEEELSRPILRPEAFGPISQGKFLAQMGIVLRVEKKIEDPETTDEEAYEIYSAMERLMVPEQMGERYKVLAIALKKEGLFPPPGF